MNPADLSEIISAFTSGSDQVADQAARELAASGALSLDVYQLLLADPRPDVRWWAVRSLAEIHSPEIILPLIDAMDDPQNEVRQCAVLALQKQPDARAIPPLVVLLKDSDQLLRRLAGDALIAAGNDAVPDLLEVLAGSHQQARIEAARALALIGDTRAIPDLFKALDSDSALLEYWAGDGLERMGVGMVFFSP
jgi:HEAT repeat protein